MILDLGGSLYKTDVKLRLGAHCEARKRSVFDMKLSRAHKEQNICLEKIKTRESQSPINKNVSVHD